MDALRASEYRCLDAQQQVYLYYTGGGLHAESQVREHVELLNHGVFGNPHSASVSSSGMTSLVEQARRAVLRWFNAGNNYTAVFTQNATAALIVLARHVMGVPCVYSWCPFRRDRLLCS